MIFLLITFIGTSIIKFIWNKEIIPHTILYLLYGLLIGFISLLFDNNTITNDINIWSNLDQHMIMLYFIPPLLFQSSSRINYHIFNKLIYNILTITIFGVLINTYGIALLCYNINIDWNTSVIIGCILSATDPITIITIMDTLNISEFIHVILEGESLLNDGLSIFIFNIYLNNQINHISSKSIFIWMFFGSFIVGQISYYSLSFILKKIQQDKLLETTITIIFPFLTFYIAEKSYVSGVLSIVILGINMSRYGNVNISTVSEFTYNHFWEISKYILNTLLFVLMGLIMITNINLDNITNTDYGISVGIYILSNILRLFTGLICYPIYKKLNDNVSIKDIIILSLSGLKGEISVVLTLTLNDIIKNDKIMLYLFSNILLSIILNSIIIELLLKFTYNKIKKIKLQKQQMEFIKKKILDKSKYNYTSIINEGYFINTNWENIKDKLVNNDIEINMNNNMMILDETFLHIAIKNNTKFHRQKLISNNIYIYIRDILEVLIDDPITWNIKILNLINMLHKTRCTNNKRIIQYNYIRNVCLLYILDKTYIKFKTFINNDILCIQITFKYNIVKKELSNHIYKYKRMYKIITDKIDVQYLTNYLLYTQEHALRSYYLDGEVNDYMYNNILLTIRNKYIKL